MSEIALSKPLPLAPADQQAHSDAQVIQIWLHGRSLHTQRAYAADIRRFCAHAGKPLATVTLADLQAFADSLQDLAPASRYRTLSAVKSLVGIATPGEWPEEPGVRFLIRLGAAPGRVMQT